MLSNLLDLALPPISIETAASPEPTLAPIIDGTSSNLTSIILLIAIYLIAAGLVITLIILFCKQRSAKKRANGSRRN